MIFLTVLVFVFLLFSMWKISIFLELDFFFFWSHFYFWSWQKGLPCGVVMEDPFRVVFCHVCDFFVPSRRSIPDPVGVRRGRRLPARPPPAGRPRLARAACSFRQGRPSVSRGPPGLRRRVFVCPFLVSHRFSARRFELCSHILCLFFHMNFSIARSSQRKKSKTSHFYWPRVNIINELEENWCLEVFLSLRWTYFLFFDGF